MFVWRKVGVIGPTPLPFFGNALDIATKGLFNAISDWEKKYGSCFGVYIMREPMLLTTDLEILTQVMIKDYDNFSSRAPEVPLLPDPVHLGLVTVGGARWKKLRNILSPSFSAGKLKKMESFITRCCDNLVWFLQDYIDERKPVRVKDVFGAYTLDVFAGTGLGLKTNCLVERDNDFLNNVEAVLKQSDFLNAYSAIAVTFPFLTPILRLLGCSALPFKQTLFVGQTIHSLINYRRTNQLPHSADLLQLLLQAQTKHPDLTDDEIVAQGIVFFVAGYDTSSTCLQFLFYLLATHPDKQERLYGEILKHIREDKAVNYTNVGKIQYLESCIYETLRLYPPVPVFARKAKEERTIRGVTIPAGCSVGAPVASILRNPLYFDQPDDFIPERFQDPDHLVPTMLKNMPFGLGPRRCVGMSLALFEIKLAIVSVLRHFRFVRDKDTPDTITLSRNIVCTPIKPLVIGCEKRHMNTEVGSKSSRRFSVAALNGFKSTTSFPKPQKRRKFSLEGVQTSLYPILNENE